MIRHAALPVPILAVIPVIAAAMIPVLPVPVAGPAARPVMTRFMSDLQNAAQAVTAVRSIITLIPARTAIRPQAALVITGMISRQNPVPAA